MKKILIALTMCAALSAAQAKIFYNETFTYPDGDLTAQSGGLWAAHSGAASGPVQVLNGEITLDQTTGREDVNRATDSPAMGAGDIWYAAFDVAVSGSSSTVYFAHFIEGTSYFASRLFVTAPTSTGDFAFGLSGSSSSPQQVWGTDGTFGTAYRLVVSYNYDTMESKLWVNPAQESSASLSDVGSYQDAITGFAFRQSSGGSTEVIDNLVVADNFMGALTGMEVPEPGTMGLCLLGGLALVARLRRPRA